jgi:hypothetical protein
MAKLRLGSLPDDRPVRITITMSAELQGRLLAYADAWAAETGRTIELPKIIPAIVEQFIRSDRAFARKKTAAAGKASLPQSVPSDKRTT